MYLTCWQNPDGTLKLKELKKFIVKSLKDSGYTEDKNQVSEMIEQKVRCVYPSRMYFCLGAYIHIYTHLVWLLIGFDNFICLQITPAAS